MTTILMLLGALLTIYLTSVVLGERKDDWFARRQGQRPAAEATWRDRFQFGPPRTRQGWGVVAILFVVLTLQAWLVLHFTE